MKIGTTIVLLVLFLVLADLIYGSYAFDRAKKNFPVLSKNANTNQPESQPDNSNQVKSENNAENVLVFVGDIMLSRQVGLKIDQAGDVNAPFLNTSDVTQKADIAFANLESPFNDSGKKVTAGMVFKAEPPTVGGLTYAGFDIVSLANNHFGNQGPKGMDYTFSLLSENNIKYVGAGKTATEAGAAVIIEKNGTKFAYLAYNDMKSTITPQSYQASVTQAGVNPFLETKMVQDIEEAKKNADVVIVTLHWGTEYKTAPSAAQIKTAHLAIDSGASLIIGHHPHVVQYVDKQPFEKYSPGGEAGNDGYIFYSLGNFVFDQMWSTNTKKGEIARINFKGKTIESVDSIPITIYNYFQPKPD